MKMIKCTKNGPRDRGVCLAFKRPRVQCPVPKLKNKKIGKRAEETPNLRRYTAKPMKWHLSHE